MDERELERMLERVLRQDFSAGTEEFRDALLERCLAELRAEHDALELSDADLGMLAAAGDTISADEQRVLGYGG